MAVFGNDVDILARWRVIVFAGEIIDVQSFLDRCVTGMQYSILFMKLALYVYIAIFGSHCLALIFSAKLFDFSVSDFICASWFPSIAINTPSVSDPSDTSSLLSGCQFPCLSVSVYSPCIFSMVLYTYLLPSNSKSII